MSTPNQEASPVTFTAQFWEAQWDQRPTDPTAPQETPFPPANPYLAAETRDLPPGTALDAGCGVGSEALWLAAHGWQVSGADISHRAIQRAAARTPDAGLDVEWLVTDLTTWTPERRWDLVVSNYAHTTMPQLTFYQLLAEWVAPGGTLLLIGHSDSHNHNASTAEPPEHATVHAADIANVLDPHLWTIDTAQEYTRHAPTPGGGTQPLHDVVLRASRTLACWR